MVKWNSSQLLDFLSSNLIAESKMEDGKSIFNIKDAAKYCFDKFKNNSFEKTEISLEELDKLGIKNSKYPLEISFAVDKESSDNPENAKGWITFDEKSQRFVIKLNGDLDLHFIGYENYDKNSDNFYNYWFPIFFHEFTHFCQEVKKDTPLLHLYKHNIINLLYLLNDKLTYNGNKRLNVRLLQKFFIFFKIKKFMLEIMNLKILKKKKPHTLGHLIFLKINRKR